MILSAMTSLASPAACLAAAPAAWNVCQMLTTHTFSIGLTTRREPDHAAHPQLCNKRAARLATLISCTGAASCRTLPLLASPPSGIQALAPSLGLLASHARTHSVLSHHQPHTRVVSAPPADIAHAAQEMAQSTAASPTAVQEDAAPSLVARWFGKTQPRMKGITRKLALRAVNRKIVARMARRFTIGIPVLGMYFVSKLICNDIRRACAEYTAGDTAVAALFATAVAADAIDLAAQFTIISGIAHGNWGVGLASAAALLVAADKASLATAALSFSCGLGGELLALKHAGDADKDAHTH